MKFFFYLNLFGSFSRIISQTEFSWQALFHKQSLLHIYHSLHHSFGRTGGWIPQISDQNQWLQVDFGHAAQITGISTQGHHFENIWVKSYSLRYSSDGADYEEYQPASHKKVNLLT